MMTGSKITLNLKPPLPASSATRLKTIPAAVMESTLGCEEIVRQLLKGQKSEGLTRGFRAIAEKAREFQALEAQDSVNHTPVFLTIETNILQLT